MAALVGGICIKVMEDSAEFQLNDSVEGIAQEDMAVILDKKELETIIFILGRCGYPGEAKEGLEAESKRDKEALNRCGTETVTITVTQGKDASKDVTGNLLIQSLMISRCLQKMMCQAQPSMVNSHMN